MMLLRRPSVEFVAKYLRSQQAAPLSYDFVGASQSIPDCSTPSDFVLDRRREQIGSGEAAWQRAKQAVQQWVMFQNGWTELHAPAGPPRIGNVVAMQTWLGGFWWLNPCRVLYEIDEDRRFGFGYGTLLDHVERGEERFLVERDADGRVWYDLASFSRPRHILLRLCYPLTRRVQLRFGVDSMRVMRSFVETA